MSYRVLKTCSKCGQPLLIEMQGQKLGCTCDCYDTKVAETCIKTISTRTEPTAFYRETPSREVAERIAGVFNQPAGYTGWAQKSPYSSAWWALIADDATYTALCSGSLRLGVMGKGIVHAYPVSSAGGMRTK